MWKFFVLLIFLSVNAQRFKLNQSVRDGVEILNAEAFQNALTYRLPNTTRPVSYILNLNFGDFHEGDIAHMSFTGNVMISIRVVEDTDTITLHNSVAVIETTLRTSDDSEILHTRSFDLEREFLVIKTTEMLLKDTSVNLLVTYVGQINASPSGIYRGSYLSGSERRCRQASPFKSKLIFFSHQVFHCIAYAADIFPPDLSGI